MKDKKLEFKQLYWAAMAQFEWEQKQLLEDYQLAMNMACSTWEEGLIGLRPVNIHPEHSEKLRENLFKLQDEIQYRKYLTTLVYEKVLGPEILDGNENYVYWKEKEEQDDTSSVAK